MKTLAKANFFVPSPEMMRKIIFFWKKLFFLKTFQWTRRRKFWRPCRKTLDKRPQMFQSMSANFYEKIFSKNAISLKMFLCTRKQEFWHSCQRNFLQEMRNYCAQVRKMMEKVFSPKNFFSSKWSSGHVEWSFDKHGEKIWTEDQKFSALNLKLRKNLDFISRWNFLKVYFWTRRK